MTDIELTLTEKRVLLALAGEKGRMWDTRALAEQSGLNEDATMQAAFMLVQKGLCTIKEEKKAYECLTEEGKRYADEGPPETKIWGLPPLPFQDLKTIYDNNEKEANVSGSWSIKKGYAIVEERNGIKYLKSTGNTSWVPPEAPKEKYPNFDLHGEMVRIVRDAEEIEEEVLFNKIKDRIPEIENSSIKSSMEDMVRKRKWLKKYEPVKKTCSITDAGLELISRGISIEEEIAQLTPELIRTGSWKGRKFKTYDVNLPSKEEFPAKIHPYQRILDTMRHIFTEMGFSEIKGDLIQSAFWNFDALFVPQDHPAREMQDTFYLGVKKPLDVSEEVIRNVKEMHEHGGSLPSTGWGGEWRRELSEELLLRTHTTAVTLWYLASHPEPPVKVFSIDRVYRRETIDATHLPEFYQLEGIVMDKGVTFSNLLGLLATFYRKMGFPSIRFRPGYFPYTEPSVEVEVYMAEHGWLESGGAGVFREEVTNPIGVNYPVLAWGLGIERLAMLSLGLRDIRDLYRSDIDWLRNTRIFR
jgi:phenylalanyl-tRNA synthetase alpha chain